MSQSEATSTTDLNALDSFLSATACHSSAPTSNMCQPCESNPTHRSPEYGLGLVAEKQPQQPDTHSRSSGEQPPLTPNGLDALSGFLSGGSAQPQGDVANESTLEELDLEGAGGKSIACGGTTQSRDATEAYGIDGLDGFFSTATTRSSLDKVCISHVIVTVYYLLRSEKQVDYMSSFMQIVPKYLDHCVK